MLKKIALLGICFSFLGTIPAQATPYDDCIKDFAAKGPTGDYEYAICMKQEAARLLAEVQKVYTQIANDKFYESWNKGNGIFKGKIRDTYNAWLVYRNNYCDLIAVASENAGGSEDYNREQCRLRLTKEQLSMAHMVISTQMSDPD